jgi:hypothetical protein
MSFEDFSKKLTKALQRFERAGRAKHDRDVIDCIWTHIQCAELSQLISALKVGQGIYACNSRQILQELAKEIPNISTGSNFQPRVSEIGLTNYTFDGEAPSVGVHTSEGKLYCGNYHQNRWFSDEVTQFRDEITAIRERHGHGGRGPGGGRGGRGRGGRGGGRGPQNHEARRKLQELQTTNDELNRKLSALQAKDSRTVETPAAPSNARDAFGGRESMLGRRPGSNG